jgi:cytochrome c oxidase assembly factor CtaG
MVLWHLPAVYDAADAHVPVHVAEHLTYLTTSVAFWWAVGLGGTPHGGAVVAVFVAALPGSAIGAALTLASRPVYRGYTSLTDQQLAGVVMWAFAGLAYVLAAAVTFALWLRAAEQAAPPPLRSEVAHG